jgi:hypothetical protein
MGYFRCDLEEEVILDLARLAIATFDGHGGKIR